ncbi:MAG: PorT family protein [bacterium]|nr:PorT family protein [bacterium]
MPMYKLVVVLTGLLMLLNGFGPLTCLAAKDSGKPRFYIKIKGIGSQSDGGFYGDFTDLNEIYFNELNDSSAGYDIALNTTPVFRGYGGEIGFETGRYAIGISGGYLERNFQVDFLYTEADTGVENRYTRDHRFSAIPVFLFIHYKLIDTRFLNAFLTLGEGVYLATYRDDLVQTFKNSDLDSVTSYVESKHNQLGFHLGASFDFKISRNLALFVDAAYRWVRFREMEAKDFYTNNTLTEPLETEGDFYYWTNTNTGEARFVVGEDSNRGFWVQVPAELDLNGFSLSVGIKITFGSGKRPKPVKIAPVD